jgi:hypothetical protein
MIFKKIIWLCCISLLTLNLGLAQTQISFLAPKDSELKYRPYNLKNAKILLIVEKDSLIAPKTNDNLTYLTTTEIASKIEKHPKESITICIMTNRKKFKIDLEKELFDYHSKNTIGFIIYKKKLGKNVVSNGNIFINGTISRPITAKILKR